MVPRLRGLARTLLANPRATDDWDDMVQVALVGLWRAGLLYRPWSQLLAIVAKRDMIDWIRVHYGRRGSARHTAGNPDQLDDHETWGRTLASRNAARDFDMAEARATLARLPWRRLSDREALIFELRAGGMTQRAIGDELGITESRVCQILSRARGRLTA